MIGCLGILHAGAAYLPIDSNLPLARIEELLSIGKVSLIVTENALLGKLKLIEYVNRINSECIIALDDKDALYMQCSDQAAPAVQKKESLAYVIFTSGSTGTPKGVMLEHEAVTNTILDINERYQVNSSDRVLALSSLTFDLSVYDIFGMLAAGGAIVFPDPDLVKDPNHWLELLVEHKITVWNTVPMFMQMLTTIKGGGKESAFCAPLRLILLSGDWIPIELPNQITSFLGHKGCQIVSLGGATEAAIWSIYYDIKPEEQFEKSIPYGRPLKNQQFYVLNENLERCPEWVVGDLYIGGTGLARGYWSDPQKTAASFLSHPKLGRIYRTGDLGRLLPSGEIEFLGRNDLQIKLHGHRIELQEIEAKLNLHNDISQSIASINVDAAGNKQLVAYVVPRDNLNELGAQPNVITDHASVMQFKLSQKGIRHFSEAKHIISFQELSDKNDHSEHYRRKSYRCFENKYLQEAELENWVAKCVLKKPQKKIVGHIDLNTMKQLLSPLKAINISERPFPKYRYPSAGALYPVQLYIEINEDHIKDLPKGSYYYDQVSHQLVQITSSISSSQGGINFYLVGQLSAISPLYGNQARDFCFIEAGHMLALLFNNEQGYPFSETFASVSPDFYDRFELNGNDHIFLCGTKLLQASSPALTSQDKMPSIYLYTKPSKNCWLQQRVACLERGEKKVRGCP